MIVVIITQMIHIFNQKEKIVILFINKEKDIIEGIMYLNGILKEMKKRKINI
jgi:hypothetical protein